MNITDLRAAVRRHTGLLSTELVPDSTIDAYAVEALRELLDAEMWPFMELEFEAEIGPEAGPLTIVRSKVLAVTVLGSRQRALDFVTRTSAEDNVTAFTVSGLPTEYTVTQYESDGQMLMRVYPTPIRTEQIRVHTRLMPDALLGNGTPTAQLTVALTAAASLSDSRIWEAVAYATAVRLLNREADDSGRVQAYTAEYQSLLRRLRDFYMVNRSEKQLVLGGRRDSRHRPRTRARRWF